MIEAGDAGPVSDGLPAPEPVVEAAPAKPKRTRRKKVTEDAAPSPATADQPDAPTDEPTAKEPAADAAGGDADAGAQPRRGWWQRTFGA